MQLTLPNFLVIGAQKSGSSWLASILRQHPDVFLPSSKEIHFFDGGLDPGVDTFEKGEAWYRSHFPLKRDLGDDQRTFEASPLYIFNPLAPSRIHQLVPRVKLLVLLRNPTERAISHYFHEIRRHKEDLPLFEALEREEERLAEVTRAGNYKSEEFICHSYMSRGLYRQQLERYLDRFARHQLLVIHSAELFQEPRTTLRSVFEFLEVDPTFEIGNLAPRHVARNRRSVDPEVYECLDDFYCPHNQALYDLLGTDFGWGG